MSIAAGLDPIDAGADLGAIVAQKRAGPADLATIAS